MIRILTERVSDRSEEYEEYLEQHISGVQKAYDMIKDNLELSELQLEELNNQIRQHDASKYEDEEFYPYLHHFYPSRAGADNEELYDRAWNHHQKCNPHHWQYWILQKDSGEQKILDMPENYIIEMLCDWHSFSIKNPESTAYKWWIDNQDKMKMSENTIDLVNKYIEYFKEPLRS